MLRIQAQPAKSVLNDATDKLNLNAAVLHYCCYVGLSIENYLFPARPHNLSDTRASERWLDREPIKEGNDVSMRSGKRKCLRISDAILQIRHEAALRDIQCINRLIQ